MFPDVKDNVIHTYPSGDNHIIVEFISSGTAPDQTKFELPICTIFTIENGLITKDYTYFDNSSKPQQSSSSLNISQIGGEATANYKRFHLNGRVLSVLGEIAAEVAVDIYCLAEDERTCA